MKFTVEKYETYKSKINWATEREEDMSHYEIQRSFDGVEYETISSVVPKGGVSISASYQFIDNNPTVGFNYYRLKMVETSGHIEYSNIKVLEFHGSFNDIKIMPNPFDKDLTIVVNSNSEETDIGLILKTSPKTEVECLSEES